MTLEQEVHQHLLSMLVAIKLFGPLDNCYGICYNISTQLLPDVMPAKHIKLKLDTLISTWPDRAQSNANLWPIEGSSEEYYATVNKWQNPRRIALLDWLIVQLEQEQPR